MRSEEQKNKKRILLRLSKGVTSLAELKELCNFYERKYRKSSKTITSLIEWQSYNELRRRLSTSVFSEAGHGYPIGYRKYCIYGEYHNTKIFIELIKKFITVGKEHGDITEPAFYGQPNPGFRISIETLIHILLRHNHSINSFLNPDSQKNGYNPSSFGSGAFTEPMLILLMTLNAIRDNDWKTTKRGKNLICHIRVGGQEYTIVRKGHSKEIKSFYPRNDNHKAEFVELERISDRMEFRKK